MAIYEAMSMGLPTIVSDRSALGPIVEPAAGRTFVHNDAHSLAETMHELLAPLVGGQLGAAARRVVEQHYSWEHSAIRYIGHYERIIGRSTHSIEALTGG
jgi:alpha-1,6-mannosyltransferase